MKIKRSIVETIEVPDDVDVEDAMALLSNLPSDADGGEESDEDDPGHGDDFDDDVDADSDAADFDADEAEESDA